MRACPKQDQLLGLSNFVANTSYETNILSNKASASTQQVVGLAFHASSSSIECQLNVNIRFLVEPSFNHSLLANQTRLNGTFHVYFTSEIVALVNKLDFVLSFVSSAQTWVMQKKTCNKK